MGGKVEDLADEIVEIFLFLNEHHAIMDELGGLVADHMDAENAQFISRKDQLQKA